MCFFSTLSAAANLYWAPKAVPIPIKKFEKQNKIKLLFIIEIEANNPANVVINIPVINPNFLPILLIRKAAKIEPKDVPAIIRATGKVARDLILVIELPTMPLKKTDIGADVNVKIWDKKSKDKFRYLYVLTPKGIVEKTKITMRFMKIKMK